MSRSSKVILACLLAAVGHTCLGRDHAQVADWYRQAGLNSMQIELLTNVFEPTGKKLHERAKLDSTLGFKTLKIGAEFPIKSTSSSVGNAVRKWNFSEEPEGLSKPTPTTANNEEWECWTGNFTITVSCYLTQGDQLTTAFGQRLRVVTVELTKPAVNFDPLNDQSFMGVAPKIVGISISGIGEDFAKTAVPYFTDLYAGAKPKVSKDGQQANIGPSEEQCAAVNAKPVNTMSTNDFRLRKDCAAPITGLLGILSAKETSFKFDSPKGNTVVSVIAAGNGMAEVLTNISIMHPQLLSIMNRMNLEAKAAVEVLKKRQATTKKSDF